MDSMLIVQGQQEQEYQQRQDNLRRVEEEYEKLLKQRWDDMPHEGQGQRRHHHDHRVLDSRHADQPSHKQWGHDARGKFGGKVREHGPSHNGKPRKGQKRGMYEEMESMSTFSTMSSALSEMSEALDVSNLPPGTPPISVPGSIHPSRQASRATSHVSLANVSRGA
jgi:hypothetical protein